MLLMELLISLFLTALVMLALVQMISASSSASLLQENQALLQDQARFIARLLSTEVAQAGFRPRPWDDSYTHSAIGDSTQDTVSASSDRLVLLRWSDLNCFENRNPVLDASGKPAFHLRETTFDINSTGHLARGCRYGPSLADMTTQVRRQGLVPGVQSFQLLFGEDSDADGRVDRWVNAGGWLDERRVLGIRAGLLLRGEDSVVESRNEELPLLDSHTTLRSNGRLHQAVEIAAAIRGRLG